MQNPEPSQSTQLSDSPEPRPAERSVVVRLWRFVSSTWLGVILVLSLAGMVTPRFLLKQWRWATLVIFVVSALLTPPDPVSQVLMATPVVVLYIGSVLVAFAVVRRKKSSDDEGSQED